MQKIREINQYWARNVKLIPCLALHGKYQMCIVLKSFHFCKKKKKKMDAQKGIFFLFYQIVMETWVAIKHGMPEQRNTEQQTWNGKTQNNKPVVR